MKITGAKRTTWTPTWQKTQRSKSNSFSVNLHENNVLFRIHQNQMTRKKYAIVFNEL